MISPVVEKAINGQINAELWSAYLYLSMALDASAKSFKGLSHWFLAQSLEEQSHARLLEDYLLSRGGQVNLLPITEVPDTWPSVKEMFEDTLAHEQEVTAMIVGLVKLAREEGDFATLSRLQWFVDEQIEEEQSASDILAKLALGTCPVCGNSTLGCVLLTLDQELGARDLPTVS